MNSLEALEEMNLDSFGNIARRYKEESKCIKRSLKALEIIKKTNCIGVDYNDFETY